MNNKSNIAVKAENISVVYRKPINKIHGFKEFIINKIRGENFKYQTFNGLESVSIEVLKGECVGLIGHNGSGKSSLLKVIAGILQASSGVVEIRGRMTSLIELQAGFDPELAAIDNIFLTCALMGVSRTEIKERLDDIISFAEIKSFIDLPAKNYSSGMYAKLGFACATMVNPEVLLVDEVLAVGDERFQNKCYQHIKDMKRKKKSILFVTHDMSAIKKFCDRAYVLNKGKISTILDPQEAINRYRVLADKQKRDLQ